jgi:hypothetical protein
MISLGLKNQSRGKPVDYLRGLVTVLVMPLLPEAYRRRWRWPCILPDGPAQWFTCIFHVAMSTLLWGLAFVAYQKAFGEAVMAAMWETADREGQLNIFAGWAGVVGFFAFPFTPRGFLAWTYLLDSVVRFVAMACNGEHTASIFLAVPLWLYGRILALAGHLRTNAIYGKASEPDRLFEEGKIIRVRSTRRHPEWHAGLTFHCRDSLFRLESEGDVPEGKGRCFEYRFGPWPEQEIVRRVVLLTGEEEKLPPGDKQEAP